MTQPLDLKQIDALVRGLDDYEVQKPLGSGGMGLIYLVRQKLTNRLEVLKVLRPELAERQRLKDRFLREVQVAARLDHPNVVKTYTALDRGFLALVIEYVPGMDLDSMVRKLGPLRVDIAASIIAQAARGLEYAVSRGLVHRDIKPSNILVSKVNNAFQAKLSDFGLCKDIELNETDGLTVEGRFLGTPEYVAPEQALDPSNSTVASDVYGLGCSLFFALTGRPPYTGTNTIAVLNSHINSPIPDIREFRQDVPDGMRMLLEGMLQKDFRARFQSPQLVAERLEALRDTPTAAAAPNAAATTAPQAVADQVVTSQLVATEAANEQAAQLTSLMPAASRRPTPPRRPVAKRGKKSGIPFSLIAQILMPIIFLSAVVLYLRPWVPQSTKGVLVFDKMTPDVIVKIDERVINTGKERQMEKELEAGPYNVQYMYGEHLLDTRQVELKPRQKFTLEVTFRDLDRLYPDVKKPPKAPDASSVADVTPPSGRPDSGPGGNAGGNSGGSEPSPSEGPDGVEEVKPTEPPPPPKASKYPLIAENLGVWSIDDDQSRIIPGVDIAPSRLTLLPKDFPEKGNELVASLAPGLQVWDAKLGSTIQWPAPFLHLTNLSVAPKPKLVLYANEYICEVYQWQKPIPPAWFKSPIDMNTKRVYAMTADGKFLGCCDHSESFSKVNLQTKKPEPSTSSRRPIGSEKIKSIALTSRLDQVVVLSQEGQLLCWETTKGDPLGESATEFAHLPIAMHLVNLPNQSNQVITVSMRGEFEVRKLPKLDLVAGYRLFDNMAVASCVSNRLLAVADSSGQVYVVDLNDSSLILKIPAKENRVATALAFNADSKLLAVGYDNSTIGLFNLKRQATPKPEPARE